MRPLKIKQATRKVAKAIAHLSDQIEKGKENETQPQMTRVWEDAEHFASKAHLALLNCLDKLEIVRRADQDL